MTKAFGDIGVVAIGRNEGARLERCLDALPAGLGAVVYVDSGSTDGSVEMARGRGAQVVLLDTAQPFTAARARNAGLKALPELSFVQFLDGDCEIQSGWLEQALAWMQTHPRAGVVCGRRRERAPGVSVYNRLIDEEWNTPIGEARACGGDALMRSAALVEVGGFNPSLIAGEEPELCVRLRGAGWQVWRLDAEMVLHDAALTRFGQWWTRARRGGHAFAEGAALHGAPPERHFVQETRRALLWGLGLPVVSLLLAVLISPWAMLLLGLYPAQVVRLALRSPARDEFRWTRATFLTLAKLPEALGVGTYIWRRLWQRPAELIEYK